MPTSPTSTDNNAFSAKQFLNWLRKSRPEVSGQVTEQFFALVKISNPEKVRQLEGVTNIISAELSEEVVAQNIMTYLDPDSVQGLVELSPFCGRFQLSKYYCKEHGTKLERDVLKRKRDNEAEGDDRLGGSGNIQSYVHKVSPSPKKCRYEQHEVLQCEDCEEAKRGKYKCESCSTFQNESDFGDCTACGKAIACYDCHGLLDNADICRNCGFFCYDCRPEGLWTCECCSETYCDACIPENKRVGCDFCDDKCCGRPSCVAEHHRNCKARAVQRSA